MVLGVFCRDSMIAILFQNPLLILLSIVGTNKGRSYAVCTGEWSAIIDPTGVLDVKL